MKHHLAPANGRVRACVALDIALDQLDVIKEGNEVRATAGRKVVEDSDFVSEAAESLHDVRADESSAPVTRTLMPKQRLGAAQFPPAGPFGRS